MLYYHLRATRPEWYVASMLPIRFSRPTTNVVGQLGPDAFVALAEDRSRQSYDLTAGENPPAFVLDVVSPASVVRDLELKRAAYFELGVREYALVDPTDDLAQPPLQGFRRQEERFVPWESDAEGRLRSELLELWLIARGPDLRLMQLDGTWVPTYQDMRQRGVELEEAQQRVMELEAKIVQLRAEQEHRTEG